MGRFVKKIIIIGGGDDARVLISTLKALRREIIGILHPDEAMIGQAIEGIPVLGNDEKIREYTPDSVELVNGIGSIASTQKRRKIYEKFKKDGYSFAAVVHPSATVMDGVALGEGAQVMAGAVIQIGCAIGDNTIVNPGLLSIMTASVGRPYPCRTGRCPFRGRLSGRRDAMSEPARR